MIGMACRKTLTINGVNIMETKKKIKLPGRLKMVMGMPLSMPVFLWLSTHRQPVAWTGFVKTVFASLETKTFWDWMDLLLLPLILLGGTFLLSRSRRNTERFRVEENAALERELANDRQREAALQAYFDRMADLMLKDKLSKFSPDEVRHVAKIRTLSILRGLDPKRKGLVLLFLKDSGLIDREAVIDLCGADLSGTLVPFASLGRVNLSEADLSGADLQGAGLAKAYLGNTNLKGANLVGANLAGVDLLEANLSDANLAHARLSGANLNGANLQGCNLKEANLSEADLSGVNLSVGDLIGANLRKANLGGARLAGANLSQADLSGAELNKTDLENVKSLEGATLPDGTKHQ
jgi:uncharacterized protein YjbI with pentapeptide repeats